ncbi:MAG: cobyrinate a,c-diamide synthase [Chloroflexota bacterium]|nr:cobyrinate a,c-diamide synthase [Dehalococcoidia bacterium]MDW8252598.1 cobyrinate a,c-diamide synthase [Chloroflexota bacterium]
MRTVPRIVLAAPSSGAGKTTVALVAITALRRAGERVQPFKAGPDYIDPSHLGAAAGRTPYNLDTWFLTPSQTRGLFAEAMRGATIAVVEGVMGMFDGRAGAGSAGSTADLAAALNAPVLLVVDASGMASSIAAVAHGFAAFDRRVQVGGVIANRVGSERHADLLREALAAVGLPLVGWLPNDPQLHLPERHLGLILAGEMAIPEEALRAAGRHLDVAALVRLARSAGPLPPAAAVFPEPQPPRVRIGWAEDAAFQFAYPETRELLRRLGAEIVPFSPLADAQLPAVDALYFGGGYPELHAEALAANRPMREAIRAFPGPIVAECGGYMYLAQALVIGDRRAAMVGLLPGQAVLADRPVLGYREVIALRESPVALPGWRLRGHEFHYARMEGSPLPAWRLAGSEAVEGFSSGRVLGSFVHLYLLAHQEAAARFVAAAEQGSAARAANA